MSSNQEPTEPPPPYTPAPSSSSTNPNPASASSSSTSNNPSSHLQVPSSTTTHKTRNGIPPHIRRSMEDESRSLPPGWIRQYDPQEHHQFFVDTTVTPPRSIWHHPYDDDAFMSSLSPEERERIEGLHEVPTHGDRLVESSDDDEGHHSHTSHTQGQAPSQRQAHFADGQLPPRPQNDGGDKKSLARKMKDKLTNTTHEQREAERVRRAEEEQKAYEQHLHIRRQMSKAMETGEPQLLGKDRQGKDIYIEPPVGYGGFGGRGMGMGMGGAGRMGYAGGGYGYNPYVQGPYRYDPNARYLRPQGPYGRPYGGGYGGGMGLPLLGGLGGGLLLGGLLF